LHAKHVLVDHQLGDFVNNALEHRKRLRAIFERGTYIEVLGVLEWILRHPACPLKGKYFDAILGDCRSAYRLVDDYKTFLLVGSEAERQAIKRALADLSNTQYQGAAKHLRLAVEAVTRGKDADCIRESIHAVESIARTITGADSLAGALQKLENRASVHPALKRGFQALYGYTSDEDGIRHALLEKAAAQVDQADALFMLGACAAFVSYLAARGVGFNKRP
jgi:hypothetical protein